MSWPQLRLRRLRLPLPVAPRTCACRGRSQQAVDATIVSPITRAGEAQPGADTHPGQALVGASQRKRRQTYPKFVHARCCRLVVVGVDFGGRFSDVATIARGPAGICDPAAMQPAARSAWVARWSGLLARAAQNAFAAYFPQSNIRCYLELYPNVMIPEIL